MLLFYIYNEEMGIFLRPLTTFNILGSGVRQGLETKKIPRAVVDTGYL